MTAKRKSKIKCLFVCFVYLNTCFFSRYDGMPNECEYEIHFHGRNAMSFDTNLIKNKWRYKVAW